MHRRSALKVHFELSRNLLSCACLRGIYQQDHHAQNSSNTNHSVVHIVVILSGPYLYRRSDRTVDFLGQLGLLMQLIQQLSVAIQFLEEHLHLGGLLLQHRLQSLLLLLALRYQANKPLVLSHNTLRLRLLGQQLLGLLLSLQFQLSKSSCGTSVLER